MSKKDENSLVLRLLLTSSSAVVAECATFPIDITKTRLQLQGELGATGVLKRTSAFQTAAGIVRDEGLGGLYRGLSPAVLRHTFYSSIRIVSYETFRTHVTGGKPEELGVGSRALLGASAGIIAQIIASPADLIKIRMQADGRLAKLGQPRRYTGMANAFSTIVQSEGLPGLWRGVGPNVYRAALVNMGELAAYDEAKQMVLRAGVEDGVLAHSFASVLSGLSATLVSCPADVIKTRMMNQLSSATSSSPSSLPSSPGGPTFPAAADVAPYKNSLDCLVRTVKAEGSLALWKGFWPTWARMAPWQLVFWISYEQMRKAAGLASF